MPWSRPPGGAGSFLSLRRAAGNHLGLELRAACCGREGRLGGSQCGAGRWGWLASLGMPRASVSPPVRQGVKPHPFLRWAPLQPLQCSPRPGEGQAGKEKKKAQFYSDLISRAPQVQRPVPHTGTSPIWLTVQAPAGAGWSRLSGPGVLQAMSTLCPLPPGDQLHPEHKALGRGEQPLRGRGRRPGSLCLFT